MGGIHETDHAVCVSCSREVATGVEMCVRCALAAEDRPHRVSPSFEPTSGLRRVSLGSDLQEPGKLLGAYRIVSWLASGGIGHIYLADHVKLGRRVALKMLRQEYGLKPEIVSRFFAEARAANQIAHENIVQITDFVEDAEEGSYLIMELLEGEDLGTVLAREGVLEPRRAASILSQVASALAAAHEVKVVHRDLKPENVFLTPRAGRADFVKLLDFGIAKLASPMADGRTTAAGAVIGTPAYMSPEQALGHAIDGRTDIYAFGVVLFELLTGRLPFEAQTLGEFILEHATSQAPAPSERIAQPIPQTLDTLCLWCLAKEREARPQTMREVEAALIAILATMEPLPGEFPIPLSVRPSAPPREEPTLAELEPDPPAPPPPPRRRSSRLVWAGLGSLALVALALTASFLFTGGASVAPTERDPRARPGGAPLESRVPGTQVSGSYVVSDHHASRSSSPGVVALGGEAAPTPAATMIRLDITSSPSGATVHRDGQEVSLGTTPLALDVAQADQAASFELRSPGHEPTSRVVDLGRSATVHLQLPRLEAQRAPAPSPQRPARMTRSAPVTDRRAVIDPFQ